MYVMTYEQGDMVAEPERQPVSDATLRAVLDGLGNHEAKLAVGIFLLTYQGSWTAPEIARALNTTSATGASIKPSSVNSYLERSLEPAGLVDGSGRTIDPDGVERTAWESAGNDPEGELALAGFLADWSIRWGLSVQHVLGASQSRSEVKSPNARWTIYTTLVNAGGRASIPQVVNALRGRVYTEYPEVAVAGQIDALVDRRILRKTSNRRDSDLLLTVLATGFRHNRMGIEDVTPETRAFYAALGNLTVGGLVTVNEIVMLAAAYDPTIDPAKLRVHLARGVSEGNGYPGVKLVGSERPGPDTQSYVEFTEEAEEAIRALQKGLEMIRSGRNISHYAARAREIIASAADLRFLLEKARSSSGRANSAGSAATHERLVSIIGALGQVTIEQAQKALEERYGQQLSYDRVGQVLAGMASAGQVTQGTARTEAYSGIVSNVYSLPQG